MAVLALSRSEIPLLVPLIEQHPYKKYQYIRPMPAQAIQKYTLYQLEKTAEEGQVWGEKSGDTIRAYLAVKKLTWDSEILGVPCARITDCYAPEPYSVGFPLTRELLKTMKAWAREENISFIDVRVDTRNMVWVHALEEAGFRTMETAVLYAFVKGYGELFPRPEPTCTVRLATAEDLDFLKRVAGALFTWDRFHRDPKIPPESASALYQNWVENIVNGTHGAVFIVEADGKKLGFHTASLDEEFNQFSHMKVAQMELIAIIPHPRVSHVWENLIYEMISRGLEYGVSVGESRTQLFNLSAMWRLMRTPPHFLRTELTLHYWNE
ncbi:MAG: hypothetical protein V2G48_00795 [bacterium JZ-2024 1]